MRANVRVCSVFERSFILLPPISILIDSPIENKKQQQQICNAK